MRVNLINDKAALIKLVWEYLSDLLVDKRVDLIINGTKTTGVIKQIQLEQIEHTEIIFIINDSEHKIPVLDETKCRFGKELCVLETKNHTAVVEILD